MVDKTLIVMVAVSQYSVEPILQTAYVTSSVPKKSPIGSTYKISSPIGVVAQLSASSIIKYSKPSSSISISSLSSVS